MTVEVEIQSNDVVKKLMAAFAPETRASMHALAADELAETIGAHIRRYAMTKHATARRFGAQPTGHYENGVGRISTSADSAHGEVVIPIPGISRAWGPVEITPVRANRLTVPITPGGQTVYGKTVGELRALGWRFFQGQRGHEAEDILFGYRGKGKEREVKAMFVLKTFVRLEQDASLLPTKEELSRKASNAIIREVMEVVKKARGAA